MNIDDRSHELFGRYDALRVYAAIARLSKASFTTNDVARLTGVATPPLSKELGRLCRLGLLHSVSRRGDYDRNDETSFWIWCDAVAREWGDE